jgi:hypothetical protein
MDTIPHWIECRKAREFIEQLQALLLENRLPEMAVRHIFRGQGDTSWGLVPSALRPCTVLGYENRDFRRVVDDTPKKPWEMPNAEAVALFEFLRLADQVGLDIPASYKWLREWNPFQNVVGRPPIGTGNWPPEELYEALALAQHHRVPTRLLDFTYDPLVAAFFAAADPPDAAERLGVWCIDLQLVDLAARNVGRPFELVTVPRLQNKNLAAQKGLFLLDRWHSSGYERLEDRIIDYVRIQVGGDVVEGSLAVRKFSLPRTECSELLDLLSRLGIDRAHLMPSFSGVVEELEARRYRRAGLSSRAK